MNPNAPARPFTTSSRILREDGPGTPKRKKARLAPPSIPCDSCRSQKTACRRSTPNDETCDRCKQRKLKCVVSAPRGRGRDVAPPREGSPMVPDDSSPDGRLSLAEQSEALLASLMDVCFNTSTYSTPIVHWMNLRERFERAGRRPRQCDVMTEPLVMICITFGALISDHPLIIGSDAPRLGDLRRLNGPAQQKDLSQWAVRRHTFCSKMVSRCVDLVGNCGAFRIANNESIAALGMCADLLVALSGTNDFELCRPYWASAVSHVRHLAEKNQPVYAVQHLCTVDAFRAIRSGKIPLWDEEDFVWSISVTAGSWDLPDLADLSKSLETRDWALFARLTGRQWIDLVRTSRNFAAKISRPLFRRGGAPIAAATFLDGLKMLAPVLTFAQKAFELVISHGDVSDEDVVVGIGSYLIPTAPSAYITHTLVGACTVILIASRHWQTWKTTRSLATGIVAEGADADEEGERKTLKTIDRVMAGLLAEAVCAVGDIFDRRRDQAGLDVVSQLSVMKIVQHTIERWATVVLLLPVAEKGGPPKLTRRKQLELMRVFVDTLEAQSWTWPERHKAAVACRAKLARLEVTAGESPSSPTRASPPPSPASPARAYAEAAARALSPVASTSRLPQQGPPPSAGQGPRPAPSTVVAASTGATVATRSSTAPSAEELITAAFRPRDGADQPPPTLAGYSPDDPVGRALATAMQVLQETQAEERQRLQELQQDPAG